jgi:hypothetical protein
VGRWFLHHWRGCHVMGNSHGLKFWGSIVLTVRFCNTNFLLQD